MESDKIVRWGPWQIATAARHVLCSDGRRRYARLTGEPDSYYIIPAVVQVQGKSVTGFIAAQGDGDILFHAYQNKKNGHLLP